MKKLRKVFAVLLTLAMVLGMSMTSFAAGMDDFKNAKAQLSINGIKEEVSSIKAYRIVSPDYNNNGLVGYHVNSGYTIADTVNFEPTVSEITRIAGSVKNATPTYSGDDFTKTGNATNGFTYTMNATAGEYLVVIESPNYIYNPIVISAAYTNANSPASLATKEVSATSSWSLVAEGEKTFVKSSEVKPGKTADVTSQEVGKPVNYTITGTIPSYSPEYENPSYKIIDSYTNLENATVPVVTIGGKKATDGKEYTYDAKENGFEITINNVASYVNVEQDERAVVVTYTATIAASASTINPATNTAKINYTHKPNDNKDSGEAKTYTHTFDILNQFNKTGEGDDVAALAGSEFTLYRENGEVFDTYTTVKEGNKAVIKFEDLAEGTYTMKETKATDGYSLNNTVYTIQIKDLEYDTNTPDKKVTKYTVYITNDQNTESQTYTYRLNAAGTAFELSNGNMTVINVQNTKLSSLPSTGGIGTTIFTIGGCAIMVIAAALFFASRRKSAK